MNMITDKLYETAVVEMAKRVGLNWESYEDALAYSKEHGTVWYNTLEWTEDDMADFKDWLIKLLRKETKWSKKKCDWEAGVFILCYGWRTKYES